MSSATDAKEMAEASLKDEKELARTVELLEGGSRRDRQVAARAIALIAGEDATKLVPYTNKLVDALNRPESQTRWEVLDALVELVPLDSRTCDKAIAGAETALFDEESGPLRLAAMRFLCTLGATTENRSQKVWPFIDEGIQCYHGDLEFPDMLVAVVDYSSGTLAPSVKKALADRMRFDAQNSKGTLKKRAQAVLDNIEK